VESAEGESSMDADANAFVLSLYRAAQRLPHAQLRTFVFEGLKAVVPFDSAFWYRWAADTEHSQLHAWCLYAQPDSLIHEYASTELWRDDIVYARALAAPSGTAVCASYDDYESARMRNFLRRHRQEHILTIAIFQDVQGIASGMSLYRNETRTAYSDAERRAIEAVIPHVIEAWRENWLQEVVREVSSTPERIEFSLAVAMPGLMLSEAQHNFGDLMHLEWPDWRGPWLPEPLHAYLSNAHDGSGAMAGRGYRGVPAPPAGRHDAAVRASRPSIRSPRAAQARSRVAFRARRVANRGGEPHAVVAFDRQQLPRGRLI
jgi:hypothetical protein